MTLSLVKTAAETALAETFDRTLPKLAGGRGVADVRRQAMATFQARGLPHRRLEEWKFTDVRALFKTATSAEATGDAKAQSQALLKAHAVVGALTFVFVDGKLVHTAAKLPQGLTVDSFAHRVEAEPNLLTAALPDTVDAGAQALVALNAGLATDGVVIRIQPGTVVAEPIHIIAAATGVQALRHRLDVGAGASATIIETHVSPKTQQLLAHAALTVGDGATLTHITDHVLAEGDFTFASTVATLGQSATYKPFVLHIGQGTARHQTTVTFKGEHATFDYGGASLVTGRGHADTTLVIDHAVPQCTSRELFKTVLNGNGRAAFQGKVIVRPDAQKTDGKQMAQAMMLSPLAEFDAKPELEIYADDVVCGHGATSAEIDPDQLFYLRARGLPELEARAMLIEGFLGEAFDKIEHEAVRERLHARAIAWLRAPDASTRA